jgi:predicted NAD-dependent protein-ADP-ribosyltransferase YbiA (DUF1768 family)
MEVKTLWFWSKSANPALKYVSNYQPCPVPIVDDDGKKYRSVEALFQGQKFNYLVGEPRPDLKERYTTSGCLGAGSSDALKRASGKAAFKKLGVALDVAKWNAVSRTIMRDALTRRWAIDPRLRDIVQNCVDAGEQLRHFQRGQHYRRPDGSVFGLDPLSVGETLMELARSKPEVEQL